MSHLYLSVQCVHDRCALCPKRVHNSGGRNVQKVHKQRGVDCVLCETNDIRQFCWGNKVQNDPLCIQEPSSHQCHIEDVCVCVSVCLCVCVCVCVSVCVSVCARQQRRSPPWCSLRAEPQQASRVQCPQTCRSSQPRGQEMRLGPLLFHLPVARAHPACRCCRWRRQGPPRHRSPAKPQRWREVERVEREVERERVCVCERMYVCLPPSQYT